MKILFLFLTSILVTSSELAVYSNDEYKFEVQFPKQHQEENFIQEERFGTIEYVKVSGQEGNFVYSIIASRYIGGEGLKRSGMKLHDFIYTYTKQMNQESFLNNNFVILSEQYIKDAIYFVVGDGATMEFITHRKIFIRNDMTYSLSIKSRSELLTQKDVDAFFKSLKIKTK